MPHLDICWNVYTVKRQTAAARQGGRGRQLANKTPAATQWTRRWRQWLSSVYAKCVGEWKCAAASQTAWPRTLIRSPDSWLCYRAVYAVHIDFPKIPVRE